MKKLLFLLLMFVSLSGITFGTDFTIEKGWNLVSPSILEEIGDELKVENIFFFNENDKKYYTEEQLFRSNENLPQELSSIYTREEYLLKVAAWYYSPEKITISNDKFIEDTKNLDKKNLTKGWNIISITPKMANPNLGRDNFEIKEITGNCNIEKSYLYEPRNQEWIKYPKSEEFYYDFVGMGWVVKVSNNCELNFNQDAPVTPPTIPNDDNTLEFREDGYLSSKFTFKGPRAVSIKATSIEIKDHSNCKINELVNVETSQSSLTSDEIRFLNGQRGIINFNCNPEIKVSNLDSLEGVYKLQIKDSKNQLIIRDEIKLNSLDNTIEVNYEETPKEGIISIERLEADGRIYVKNTYNKDLNAQVKISNQNCQIDTTLQSQEVNSFKINNCNLETEGVYSVVVITDEGVLSEDEFARESNTQVTPEISVERLGADGTVYIKNHKNEVFGVNVNIPDQKCYGGTSLKAQTVTELNLRYASPCNTLEEGKEYTVELFIEGHSEIIENEIARKPAIDSQVNQQNITGTEISVERLEADGTLYIKNSHNEDLNAQVKISNQNCQINTTLQSQEVSSFKINNCNLETDKVYSVVVIIDQGVFSEDEFARDSNTQVTYEEETGSGISVERLEADGTLYIKNNYNEDKVAQVKISNQNCQINTTLQSQEVSSLKINNCNLETEGVYSVVVITDEGVLSEDEFAR